jgi:hypothetical protein
MTEIDAAIVVERMTRQAAGLKETFFGKGNPIRFYIAFLIFLLQQWSGQNSIKWVSVKSKQAGMTLMFPQLLCASGLCIGSLIQKRMPTRQLMTTLDRICRVQELVIGIRNLRGSQGGRHNVVRLCLC